MLDSIYFDDGLFLKIKDQISIGILGAVLSVEKNVFLLYFTKLFDSKECIINKEKIDEIISNKDVIPPNFEIISFIVGK